MKSVLGLLLLTVGLALFLACEDDPVEPTPPALSKFENLTEKWHVINNLQLAYDQRRSDKYEELLDAGFTFFPDPLAGLPGQWGRVEEADIHAKLLDVDYTGPSSCSWMRMHVDWQDGITWTVVPSTSGPAETWYATVLYYDFTMTTRNPNQEYCSDPGLSAQFTIRNAGTLMSPKWQLVEFRDATDVQQLDSRAANRCEGSDWSRIKGLYYVVP